MNGDFENFKEQVRSTADMVEIISGYVPLKKKGQNYWGCCPFHGEKTPSFSVNPGKSMFYCFGCHEGGDIFKFIMKIENCSFMDALKLLAGRYGIPIPEKQPPKLRARNKGTAFIVLMNWRQNFFRLVLQELLTVNLPWLILQGAESAKKLLPALA